MLHDVTCTQSAMICTSVIIDVFTDNWIFH